VVLVGWPKPYPPLAALPITSESSPPPRLGGWLGSFSSDRNLSSGPRGSFPERDQVARPTGACNLQYPFLKDDSSRLVALWASSFPHWAQGLPLSTLGAPLRRALPLRPKSLRPRAQRRTVPLTLRRRPSDRTRFRADTRDRPRPFQLGFA